MTEKMGPQDNRIARQPNPADPQEIRIRKRLEKELLATKWAQKAIEEAREKQAQFLRGALVNLENPPMILKDYRALLQRLADITKAHLAGGESYLKEIPKGNAVILITNHLGMAKVTRIANEDLPIALPEIEAFPSRHAALVRVTDKIGASLHETAIELPSLLFEVQKACGVITIPVEGEGRTEKLTQDVAALIGKGGAFAFVMYPEGGTSGKRNEGGPYDLDECHPGAFVVAAKFGLEVLPVCQYFNPEEGLELHILKPMTLSGSDLPRIKEITENVKAQMQGKLDSLQSR